MAQIRFFNIQPWEIFAFHFVRSPLWSEEDRGGSITRESSEAGWDRNTRSINETLWLWCMHVHSLWQKISGRDLKYNGWEELTQLTLKSRKRILDSCRQKPFGSDVGFPSSTTVKCSECGRGSERTACSVVRWEGLGANRLRPNYPFGSKFSQQ